MLQTQEYDLTVSESKEESMSRAIEIMLAEIEKKQKMCKSSSIRPKFTVKDFVMPLLLILVSVGCFIALIYGSGYIAGILHISENLLIAGIIIAFVLLFTVTLKSIILWLILLYQKFAPSKIRQQCCFEPCCSEYMKISIKKYGLFKGINNGIGRLSRCHFPNGGIDEP